MHKKLIFFVLFITHCNWKQDTSDSFLLMLLLFQKNASNFNKCDFLPLSKKEIRVDELNDVKILSGERLPTLVNGYKDISSISWDTDAANVLFTIQLVDLPADGIPAIAAQSSMDVTNQYSFEIQSSEGVYHISLFKSPLNMKKIWVPAESRTEASLNSKLLFVCNFAKSDIHSIQMECDKTFLPFSNDDQIRIRTSSLHKDENYTFVDCI